MRAFAGERCGPPTVARANRTICGSGRGRVIGAQLTKGRGVYDAGLRGAKLRPADPSRDRSRCDRPAAERRGGIERNASCSPPSGGGCYLHALKRESFLVPSAETLFRPARSSHHRTRTLPETHPRNAPRAAPHMGRLAFRSVGSGYFSPLTAESFSTSPSKAAAISRRSAA